jgi:hypothetical protein
LTEIKTEEVVDEISKIGLTIYPVLLPFAQIIYDRQLKRMTEKREIKILQRFKYLLAALYLPFIITAYILQFKDGYEDLTQSANLISLLYSIFCGVYSVSIFNCEDCSMV